MKYKFILFSPWLLKSPVFWFAWDIPEPALNMLAPLEEEKS